MRSGQGIERGTVVVQEENDPQSHRYYFWMIADETNTGFTKAISFWELK